MIKIEIYHDTHENRVNVLLNGSLQATADLRGIAPQDIEGELIAALQERIAILKHIYH